MKKTTRKSADSRRPRKTAKAALKSKKKSIIKPPAKKQAHSISKIKLHKTQGQAQTERQARLASFPELNPNPVVEVTLSGQVNFANPAAKKLFPNLVKKGTAHPYLTDWKSVASTFRKGKKKSLLRETAVGDVYYQQSMYYVKDQQCVHIYGFNITKRKRAEEALRENEKRLKRSQEIAHLGGWELDLVNNRLTWSDEVYRIFGLEPQEFGATYEAFLERVHPDDRAAVDEAYSGSLRNNLDTYEIEHRVIRKDNGEIRFVHEKCEHVRDKTGKIIRSQGMVHDITERKRAEEALKASESRYRLLFESIDEGFCTIEVLFDKNQKAVDYKFLTVNPAFERQTGIRDAASKRMREIAPRHEEHWFQIYGQVALTGKPVRFQNPAAQLNRFYDVYAFRIGEPTEHKVAILFNDITERKRWENELRQSEERYRGLFENMMDGFAHCQMLFDDDGRPVDFIYLDVNNAFYEMTGLENVVGKRVSEVIPNIREAHPELLATYGRVARTGNPERFEIDFKPLAKLLSITVYSTQPNHFTAIFEDITDRKLAVEALREAKDRLDAHMVNSPLAIIEFDSSFRVVRWSGAAEQVFGWKQDEIVGKAIAEMRWVHEDDAESVRQVSEDMLTGRHPRNLNVNRNYRKDGSIVHCEWYNSAIYDEQGRLTSVFAQVLDISERKRAEDELRQSEERFRVFFESAAVGTAELNVDGNFREVNNRFCQMTGYSREELLQMKALDLSVPDERSKDRKVLENYFKGDLASYEIEKRYVRKDGQIIWVHVTATMIRDSEGNPLRSAGIIQDITYRKQAETNQTLMTDILRMLNRGGGDLHFVIREILRLIRESTGFDAVGMRMCKGDDCPYYEQNGFSDEFVHEENFLCKKGKDGAIIRDADGKVTLECTCGLVLSGRTDPSMPCFTAGGSFWTNVSSELLELAPEDDPRTNPRNRCIHSGYQSVGLFPVRFGEEIIGLLQLNDRREGLFNPESIRFFESLAGNIGLALKRKQAEEALRESEERFRTMSEAVPGIVWTTTPDGTADYYNKRWYEYTGLPANHALGSAWEKTIHPDDRQATVEAWTRSVHTGAGYKIQHRIRRADGQYRWHLSQAIPLRDSEGNTVKWFGTTTDIEDQIRNQQALERFRDELEHKNEELESIIRIASHDLRSPLTNIKGFSGELARDLGKVNELLAGVPLPEEVSEKVDTVFNKYAKEAIGFIQSSADSINQMLRSLMQVAKAGTMPINIQNLDMNALLAKMAANVQFKLKQTGGQFEIENLPGCRGDGEQITQVFTNLVENAIKYCDPARPIQIRIYGSTDKSMVTYCVEDNGKGIAEEHLEKVFDLFTRLDSEAAKGEGLGLTIAKRMIERQGGKIWVRSEVGKGSKFYVSMPY